MNRNVNTNTRRQSIRMLFFSNDSQAKATAISKKKSVKQNCTLKSRKLTDITQFFVMLHLLAFKKTLHDFLHFGCTVI